MFLEIITSLILVFIVVFYLLLDCHIFRNFKKDRELSRVREERLIQVVKRVEVVASNAVKTEQLVIDNQVVLDDKMGDLIRLMGAHNIYVTDQQEQFNALAKLDILSARRNELLSLKELKESLIRISGMATLSRQSPDAIDVLAIENVTNRIKELELILANDILGGV